MQFESTIKAKKYRQTASSLSCALGDTLCSHCCTLLESPLHSYFMFHVRNVTATRS